MFNADKQKRNEWQTVEPQQKHKRKIQSESLPKPLYVPVFKNSLGVIRGAGWLFGPLFSLDFVPYKDKGVLSPS